MFDHLIGHANVKTILHGMVQSGKIPQSLLFVGPEGVGKGLFAEKFAHLIVNANGTHPDIHIYQPEGKLGLHSMESMRQLCVEVYYPPFQAERKVFIIHDADRMLTYSANALLKTFEEPAPHSVIILLTKKSEFLLPTVLSRCFCVRFGTISRDDMSAFIEKKWIVERRQAEELAAMAQGSLGYAKRLMHETSQVRNKVLTLLEKGRQLSYSELATAVRTLADEIEKKQAEQADELRTIMNAQYGDGVNSVIQQAIEKEIEGSLAVRFIEEVGAILDTILTWFRDLQLLMTGGHPSLLFNHDRIASLEQTIQRGEAISLDQVHNHLGEVRLALERSTPLSHCLETLFLKLKYQFV